MTNYVCGLCGGEFVNDDEARPEEAKLAEMRQYFGDVPEEERASVCDDCWMKIHPDRN